MTPSVSFHAQYSDGAKYRVVYDRNERKTYLETIEGGRMHAPFYLNGAEFVRYGFDYQPQPGLRSCDVFENVHRLHAHLALLTPPAKPAVPPTPQEQDARLHLEPRAPGQSSLAQLQSAHAKMEAQARSARQQERQRVLIATNQPDLKKVQQARAAAAEALHARQRPKI